MNKNTLVGAYEKRDMKWDSEQICMHHGDAFTRTIPSSVEYPIIRLCTPDVLENMWPPFKEYIDVKEQIFQRLGHRTGSLKGSPYVTCANH